MKKKYFQIMGNNRYIRNKVVLIEAESAAAAKQIFYLEHGTSIHYTSPISKKRYEELMSTKTI